MDFVHVANRCLITRPDTMLHNNWNRMCVCVHLFQLIHSRSADCRHSWSCHSETTRVYNNLQHVAAPTTRTQWQSGKLVSVSLCVRMCVCVLAMWQVFGCGCDCCCHMSPLIKHKITLGFLAASCRCSCSVARQLPRGHNLQAECGNMKCVHTSVRRGVCVWVHCLEEIVSGRHSCWPGLENRASTTHTHIPLSRQLISPTISSGLLLLPFLLLLLLLLWLQQSESVFAIEQTAKYLPLTWASKYLSCEHLVPERRVNWNLPLYRWIRVDSLQLEQMRNAARKGI